MGRRQWSIGFHLLIILVTVGKICFITLAMKRHHIITIHLVLSTFLLPFLLMMPLTGTLYLLGEKGDQTTSEKMFSISGPIPEGEQEREKFFRDAFKEKSIDFRFEYIKDAGSTLIFRPASRDHYIAKLNEEGADLHEAQPNFLKKMIELHKGHGPRLFRSFEMIFGVGLILIALSGVWLAVLVPMYRKKLVLSFLAGALFFALPLMLWP